MWKKSLPMVIVRAMMSLYRGAKTEVRMESELSNENVEILREKVFKMETSISGQVAEDLSQEDQGNGEWFER